MSSPVQRSLGWLRDRGWMARAVEKRIPFKNITVDCFGGDILAVHPAQKLTMLVQATSASNHSGHREKCLKNEEIAVWLEAGNSFEIWSWKKGKREPRRERLELPDLQTRKKGRK